MNTGTPAPDLYDRPDWEWPTLAVGQPVRVYPTGRSSPTWFYDPATDTCTTEFSMDEFEVGQIREATCGEVDDDGHQLQWYRVTVLRGDRELYVDWLSRYWVRLLDEPGPPPLAER